MASLRPTMRSTRLARFSPILVGRIWSSLPISIPLCANRHPARSHFIRHGAHARKVRQLGYRKQCTFDGGTLLALLIGNKSSSFVQKAGEPAIDYRQRATIFCPVSFSVRRPPDLEDRIFTLSKCRSRIARSSGPEYSFTCQGTTGTSP